MYRGILSYLISIVTIGIIVLFSVGCSGGGGGGSSSDDTSETISSVTGAVQKGSFVDGEIIAQQVESNGKVSATSIISVIDKRGSYSLKIPWSGLTLLSAEGHFYNEYTGKTTTETIALSALIDFDTKAQANINLFTSLEADRILELMQNGNSYTEALEETKASMETIFGLSRDVNATALDILDLNSSLKDENFNLLLLSATFLKIIEDENNIELSSAASFDGSRGKYNDYSQRFFNDYKKDGRVDDLFESEWEKIIDDDENKTLDVISKNMDKDFDVVIVGGWARRLQLSVGTPSYVFVNGQLQEIKYDIGLTSSNFVDLNTIYTIEYNTSDITAIAGTDYNATSGTLEFTFTNNTHTVTVPVLEQSASEKQFNINFSVDNTHLVIPNPNVVVDIPSTTEYNQAANILLYQFVLNRMSVDSYSSSVSASEDVLLIGSSSSDVSLRFLYTAISLEPYEYFIKVYAMMDGEDDLLVKDDFYVRTVGQTTYYWQYANIDIDVSQDLKDLFDRANAASKDIRFRVVAELNENNTSEKTSMILPKFAKISSTMEPHTRITHSIYNNPLDENCDPLSDTSDANFSADTLYASMDITGVYNADGMNNQVGVTYDDVCVQLNKNTQTDEFDVVLLDGYGTLANSIHAEIAGADVEISTSRVTTSNIEVSEVILHLPEAHSIHEKDANSLAVARGVDTVVLARNMSIDEQRDLSTLEFSGSLNGVYFHANNLPFLFLVDEYSFGSSGLKFEEALTKYVFEYSNSHTNNSEVFSSPKNRPVTVTLNENGISVENIAFEGVEVTTAFPKLTTTLKEFDIDIENSVIGAQELSAEQTISFEYIKNCYDEECGGVPQYATFDLDQLSPILASDGSLIAYKSGDIDKVRWGSKDSDTVFQRDEDEDAGVYIVGYEMPTNNVDKIGDYLLGSVKLVDKTIHYYPTSTTEAIDGKYLFAGVNVGNFEDVDLNPLEDKIMSMQLGNGALMDVSSSKYSKYYLRRSGVTGVFNNSDADIYADVYGYAMNFSSFKFRQRENTLDPFTKINGSIFVPNKGDFNVLFNNLELSCSGNFASGTISQDQGSVVLSAWQVDSNLTTIDFENNGGDTCSDTKELKLGHIVKVAALKEKLGLNTFWSNGGIPYDSELVASRSNQLDGDTSLDTSEDNGGYDVALENIAFRSFDTSGDSRDWIETDVNFGLPFWGVSKMSTRLQNATTTQRAPSVVTARGELFEDGRLQSDTNENLVSKIVSSYQYSVNNDWANLIHFSLPVYYNASEDVSKTPEFLGRTYSSDLIVLTADAGVNYITPKATAMSFGASSHFEKLRGLDLHIDLNNPQSIQNIDNSLHRYLGIEDALQDTVGVLVENINIGNKLLKNGMSLSMERTAYLALKAAGGGSNDPFEKITQINAELHALPATIKDRFLEIFTQNLEMVFDESYTLSITKKQDIVASALMEYDELIAYLNDIDNTLDALPSITSEDMKDYIYDNTFGSRDCSYNNFTTEGFFKPIGEGNKAIHNVNDKLQNINISKIRSISEKASAYTGFDADDLVSTAEKVQRLSQDLDSLVNDLNSSLINFFDADFCSGLENGIENMNAITGKIDLAMEYKENLKIKVDEMLAIVNSAEVQDIIDELRALDSQTDVSVLEINVANTIVTPVSAVLDPLVSEIEQNIPNIDADDMRRMVVSKLFQLDVIQDLNAHLLVKLTPVADELNKLSLEVFSGFDRSINDLLAKVNDKVNEVLSSVTSKLDSIPLASAKMDGYAIFYGDSLSKLHVGSEFSVTGKDKDSSFGFNAALDIQNDENNDSVGCNDSAENKTKANLRAQISTRDIAMPLGEKELRVDLLLFGVTINSDAHVKGVFGAITSKEGFQYDTFKLYDLGLAAGIGEEETFLGAKASAKMDSLQLGVSFLVGQVCNLYIIESIIPEAIYDFITIPHNKFNGALVFGQGQMPIYDNGCALRVIARAKLGTWFLFGPPKTFGGIVGGGAFGKALCIATLGGEVEVLAEKSGDIVRFKGSGWGAAGAGWCDSSWSSVRDSRHDKWCGTGDARFGAFYDDGWTLENIRTSAVH